MDENVKNASNQYKNKFGALQIKLGNEMKINKEEILKKFNFPKLNSMILFLIMYK